MQNRSQILSHIPLIENEKGFFITIFKFKIPLIGVILICTAILRILLVSGMSQGDDLAYTAIADSFKFSHPGYGLYIFDMRWFVFLPVSLMYSIFGVSDFASLFWILILSVGNTYLAYRIVRFETDNRTGLLSAFLYSLMPLVAVYGTLLQVATPLEFATLLTIYLFQKAAADGKKSSFLKAGLAASLIPMARMSGLLLLPLLFCYLVYKRGGRTLNPLVWIKRKILPGFLIFLAASAAMLILQGIFYLIIHNNFLYRFAVSKKAIALQYATRGMDPKNLFYYFKAFFTSGRFYNPSMLASLGYTAIPALCYMIFFRLKKFYIFALWFTGYILLLTFAPGTLHPYRVLIRNTRYMIVFILPLTAVCSGMILDLLKRDRIRRITGALLLAVSIIVPAVCAFRISSRLRAGHSKHILVARKALEKKPGETVYLTDHDYPRYLTYYNKYKPLNMQFVRSVTSITRPGYLVLDTTIHPARRIMPETVLRGLYNRPPASWRLVLKKGGAKVFRVTPVTNYQSSTGAPLLSRKKFVCDLARLNPTASSGRVVIQNMLGFGDRWKNDDHVFLFANRPGPSLSFRIRSRASGKRRISIHLTTASDFGIVRIRLNGKSIGETDLYSRRIGTTVFHSKKAIFKKGENTLTLKIIGKNRKARSCRIAADYLEIR